MKITQLSRCALIALAALTAINVSPQLSIAQSPFVPGTGQKVVQVGDDFEDEEWGYQFNLPKSSKNLNEYTGGAGGKSDNGRWYEGVKRGQPDIIKRVATPAGGVEGSEGSLLLQSLRTGIQNRPTYKLQQDDFVCNIHYRLGGAIPVHQRPSFTCKVFLPPIDQWEERNGCSFAIRGSVDTRIHKVPEDAGRFARPMLTRETYWPGLFIQFESKEKTGREDDYAWIRIRANNRGGDFRGPQITQTGWWTFGMSFTPDGQVHYYASPGVDDLTEDDYLTSQYPYGYRCERFQTFFFNVCNGDDNRTWSTKWIVDDCFFYYVPQTARR